MNKLDDILKKTGLTYTTTGELMEEAVEAKQQIKALLLELIGEDEPLGDKAHINYMIAYANATKAELRQKVKAL